MPAEEEEDEEEAERQHILTTSMISSLKDALCINKKFWRRACVPLNYAYIFE